MAGGHKPRSGSLAYYPRVRAKRQLANFSTYPTIETESSKPINFFGFKAGMATIFGKNAHEKSVNFGTETAIPATIIECPPIKIIGARVYGKTTDGLKALGEATIEKPGKNLREKLKAFKKAGKKKTKATKGSSETNTYSKFDDLEKFKEKAVKVVLLSELQASQTGIGKKKADVAELTLNGTIEQQFGFAKEKFGKEIRIADVFKAHEFIDVKAVNKGKGFQGPVKRFGVKIQRPKAKKHRAVGSIGPWHPATVMWTVPRPGQMGYHTRTEYNKRILFVETDPKTISPPQGLSNYGILRSDFIVVSGSIPGPAKRVIALRHGIRKVDKNLANYTDLKLSYEGEAKKEIKEEKKEAKETHKAGKKEEKADAKEPKAEKGAEKK
ncbi:MAG: 50S ribosomal protein L3 [archaeon]|nr:50S ribosomal protein L3 [archaeon]